MRLYVPAVRADLDDLRLTANRAVWALEPRVAHAVTGGLREELPDEDDEGLEYAAWLEAVDDSLGLVIARSGPALRVVVTVEVPDAVVAGGDAPGGDASDASGATDLDELVAASTVRITEAVDAQVVCAHVDEPEAGPDVLAVGQVAEADLEAALQAVVDRDLLWYDWSELAHIPS